MKGISVVEIIIGAAIVALVVTGIASAWQYFGRLTGQSTRMAQASVLIEEGAEAIQYLRDKGWTAYIVPLNLNKEYHLVWTGTDYVATTTATQINSTYVRTVSFSSVNRDPYTANIVSSGGSLDPNTRTATLTVYPVATTSTPILQAQMLIHNAFNN